MTELDVHGDEWQARLRADHEAGRCPCVTQEPRRGALDSHETLVAATDPGWLEPWQDTGGEA